MPILSLLLAATILGLFFVPRLHPFLALTRPVRASVLVVEGWVHDYMIREAADIYKRGGYSLLLVAGLPESLRETPGVPTEPATIVGVRRILDAGIPSSAVVQVPAEPVRAYKTAATARALRGWLQAHPEHRAVNLFTGGPHARKTYVTFRKIIPSHVAVGIIAARVEHYDESRWWSSWTGIYLVLKNLVGYLHAIVWPFE